MHGFTQEQCSPKPLQQQPFSDTAPYKHSPHLQGLVGKCDTHPAGQLMGLGG